MRDKEREAKYRRYLDGELESAAVYEALADVEKDPKRAEVFRRLSRAEMRHATTWAGKMGIDPGTFGHPRPSLRLRFIRTAAKLFGTGKVLPLIIRSEAGDLRAYSEDPEARGIAKDERRHADTLLGLSGVEDPVEMVRSGVSSLSGNDGSLRAAVLGVNDGLVSNFSLVMGVAGGTAEAKFVLLAGVAGLLAGAFSMAAGEYVSMRSQRDVHERQLEMERREIEEWPEEEEAELAAIYQAKGLSREAARHVAQQIMLDPEVALDTMAREELGLDPSELGSPWAASFSSFAAFVGGAIVPIIPFIVGVGSLALSFSAVLSAVALFGVGSLLTKLSGKSAAWGGLRMLLIGGAAAAVTFGIGRLVGTSLSI